MKHNMFAFTSNNFYLLYKIRQLDILKSNVSDIYHVYYHAIMSYYYCYHILIILIMIMKQTCFFQL